MSYADSDFIIGLKQHIGTLSAGFVLHENVVIKSNNHVNLFCTNHRAEILAHFCVFSPDVGFGIGLLRYIRFADGLLTDSLVHKHAKVPLFGENVWQERN